MGNGGVAKFRILDPYIKLQELYPKDFNIELLDVSNLLTVDTNKYDYVVAHTAMVVADELYKKLLTVDNLVVDIDDYWNLDSSHQLFHYHQQNKMSEKIIKLLKHAQIVTTTTQLFAFEISKYNKAVFVLPNAIDFDETQFKPQPLVDNFIKFGYIGGSNHFYDIKLLDGLFTALKGNEKFKMVLAGFNDNIYNPQTKVMNRDALKTDWYKVEKMITDNYNFYLEDKKKLLNFVPQDTDTPKYKRIWTKASNLYAKAYNEINVNLIPLLNNKFNNMKSPLKVIEAGAFGNIVIVSDVEPYNSIVEHDITGLIIKNPKDWKKYGKDILENFEKYQYMGVNLQKKIKEEYNLNLITEKRKEIFK